MFFTCLQVLSRFYAFCFFYSDDAIAIENTRTYICLYAEGLIVLILLIDFKEIELVVCTPVNGDWPIIAYFYIITIRPTDANPRSSYPVYGIELDLEIN